MGLRTCLPTAAVAAFALLCACLFVRCALRNPESARDAATGSVAPHILFKQSAPAQISFDQDIRPSLRMVRIEITTAEGKISKEFDYEAKSAEIDGVAEGAATVKVNAIDNMGNAIMGGSVEVRVQANQTATPDIPVEPADTVKPYLAAPVQVTATAIRLSWVVWNIASWDACILERSEGGTSWIEVGRLNGEQREIVDQNNINKYAAITTYQYRLRLERGSVTAVSNIQEIKATTAGFSAALEIPFLEEARSLSSGSVEVQWSYGRPAEIAQFVLERSSVGKKGPFTVINHPAGATTIFTDNSTAQQNTYWYRLKAIGPAPANSESPYSNVVTVYVSAGASAINVTLNTPVWDGGKVSLAWNVPQSEEYRLTEFRIFRSTNGGTTWSGPLALPAPSTRSWDDFSAPVTTLLDYKVCAVEGASEYCSNNAQIYTGSSSGPQTPGNFRFIFENGNQVMLQWDYGDNTNIDRYEIQRSDNGGADWAYLGQASPAARQYIDSTTMTGTQYLFRMCAINTSSAWSPWTSQLTVEVPAEGGKCADDQIFHDGYCVDKEVFRKDAVPMNNISFVAAGDSCVAHGKRLCDTWEWAQACSTSFLDTASGLIFDMSGDITEWATDPSRMQPPYDIDYAYDGAPKSPLGQKCQASKVPRRGEPGAEVYFRCCK
ncbi:MAG: hypothetical protein A2268_16275 [Candidatus Raymondbacteria bacterium RifOxyA12_full_50_37]|uniref:Fibronectin type-III domain-containing protein n=1 Tax=Candidatus Raymondbacteria bacterium RIFOXYD12_FULL_49_13 TaxID=1817890 RepID=A0A1F7F817_UNCRA|nr:MAG: hypothetical protein A2268_16275 [Candidatus Raymondbacteria bacterium RifOxyA12_full_50_37]OGJ94354.1 MAG: hypothetical protein A2248_14470 [Candidatus Raymondbacteria bacterium RIFOXYA2_FULL_49_16]OGJ95296.1 MAG: hypothetical protein A2453_05895 [Candidatus Raymondbacteria bacterium RIFOXYC2_FULL_50_21]OGJ99817.1 MAG: hypothetical protein A2487_10795 [Candidatus Raymondbacteria bacterium RifOxyC12_full_50_8]OGK02771.1 MAG: hypothetical protein A2519_07465 [Candidatus Raymondbacteria b